MPRREPLTRIGLWLSCGGLLILAAHHLLAVYKPELSLDNLVLLGGAIAGYLITAAGICLNVTYRTRRRAAEAAARSAPTLGHEERAVEQQGELARRMTSSFLDWCEEELADGNPWNSFDRLVREMLSEQIGAVRVRCYQVLPGNQQLRSLSQLGSSADGRCARSGILGHVATTGQEFVAADPAHGQLVHQLAEETDDTWEWVYPIRQGGQTVGLVAVGKLPLEPPLDRRRRQDLALLLTTFWRHVACLEQLRIAEKTDKASGLLTRSDFFEYATRALADSYAQNEPVVVVVLALEGLRRLDDAGRWSQRDKLVETIGRLTNRRIRTDDIIGRFSDDRFVLLLRRLDSGLGRLIAAKIQDTAEEQIAQLDGLSAAIRVRVGLIGSGFSNQSLEALLVSAFDAVERARKQDIALYCDLGPAKQEVATA